MDNKDVKRKILYVITKSNWGGAQRYVYDLATKLPEENFEAIVALGGNGPLKQKLEKAGVLTISVGDLERDIGLTKEFRALRQLIKIIREVKPDIIHLNSSKAGVLGALATLLNNLYLKLSTFNFKLSTCKVIFTAHGWPFKEKRKFIIRKILECASWLTVYLSDATIVVSNDDQKRISNFLFIKSKIFMIHNGIEIPDFKDRAYARKFLREKIERQPTEKSLWIGSIAELHKNKGLDHAISGIAKVLHQETTREIHPEKISYVIIGGGEEKENLKNLVEKEGLQNIVHFAGECLEASKLLKAFDVFLLPSLKEGLPYALLEAGSANLPVIATNVGGVTEVVEDMKSGIVVRAKRPKEIADAIGYMIDYPEKRKGFGESLAKTVTEKFTLERMVEETIGIYKAD